MKDTLKLSLKDRIGERPGREKWSEERHGVRFCSCEREEGNLPETEK